MASAFETSAITQNDLQRVANYFLHIKSHIDTKNWRFLKFDDSCEFCQTHKGVSTC